MAYQLLEWDSDFFGFKVGRIRSSSLTETQVKDILSEMQKEGYQLVYWPSGNKITFDFPILSAVFMEIKITYEINLKNLVLPVQQTKTKSFDINSHPYPELEDLAIQSGGHSRFKRDECFSEEDFTRLYKEWIKKSISGEMADEILITLVDGSITGMVTLKANKGIGSIGLIAVDKDNQRKKIGQTLVFSAIHWFIENGCRYAEVVTQGDNIPACRLYKKCGFHIGKTAFFYHFWL